MDGNLIDITKEELKTKEIEDFQLPVITIDEHSTLEDVREAKTKLLEGRKVLGFDTETKPSFRKGEHHQVALLQLSSQNIVVLFRLIRIKDSSILDPLREILQSKRVLKVGIAIGDDVAGLYSGYDLITNKILDLRTLAVASGIGASSLSKIYAILFDRRISKSQQLSDWEKSKLTDRQIRYAALDAYAGWRIYMELRANADKAMISHFSPPPREKKQSEKRKKKFVRSQKSVSVRK